MIVHKNYRKRHVMVLKSHLDGIQSSGIPAGMGKIGYPNAPPLRIWKVVIGSQTSNSYIHVHT